MPDHAFWWQLRLERTNSRLRHEFTQFSVVLTKLLFARSFDYRDSIIENRPEIKFPSSIWRSQLACLSLSLPPPRYIVVIGDSIRNMSQLTDRIEREVADYTRIEMKNLNFKLLLFLSKSPKTHKLCDKFISSLKC